MMILLSWLRRRGCVKAALLSGLLVFGNAGAATQNTTEMRQAIQMGLSVGLANSVLQSLFYALLTPPGSCTSFAQLTSGGSFSGQLPAGSGSVLSNLAANDTGNITFYYDDSCARKYMAVNLTSSNMTTQYYDTDGTTLLATTTTQGLNFTGLILNFAAEDGTQATFGFNLNINALGSSKLSETAGIIQNFPSLNAELGTVEAVDISFGASINSQITFSGTGTGYSGGLNSLSLTPNSGGLQLSGGTADGSPVMSGEAGAFTLLPAMPTDWTTTLGDLKFSIAVASDTTRNLAGSVTQISTGTTLATIALDQSGTGTITYTGGSSTPVISWVQSTAQIQNGLWIVDSENNDQNGRGFQLEEHDGTMVMTYYGYQGNGQDHWYLANGPFSNDSFSGAMEQYQGGTALGGAYQAASDNGSAGNVSFSFSSSTTGTVTFPGEAPKAIEKFVFSGSTTPSVVPDNGLWIINAENNSNNGRGFQIEQHGGALVFTYYGYNSNGNEVWYLANGTMSGNTFTGTLTEYSGGTPLGGSYSAATSSGSPGQVTLTFTSPTAGTIQLPGESAKAISKFSW